jgi:hypothetical protein
VKRAPDKRAAWKELVKEFGTHYVKKVVLGGSMKKEFGNRSDKNEQMQGKDENISAGVVSGQIIGGPATRIGIGHRTSSNFNTEKGKNRIEIRGLTGDNDDTTKWKQRREQRE